jgi:hypothetical protein
MRGVRVGANAELELTAVDRPGAGRGGWMIMMMDGRLRVSDQDGGRLAASPMPPRKCLPYIDVVVRKGIPTSQTRNSAEIHQKHSIARRESGETPRARRQPYRYIIMPARSQPHIMFVTQIR